MLKLFVLSIVIAETGTIFSRKGSINVTPIKKKPIKSRNILLNIRWTLHAGIIYIENSFDLASIKGNFTEQY